MIRKKNATNIALIAAAIGLLVFLGLHVRLRPPLTNVAVLKTVGMTCSSCATKIEKALGPAPGVAGVEVDVDGDWVLVGYNAAAAKPDSFAGTVTNTGFKSWLMEKMSAEEFRKVAGTDFGEKIVRSGCCGKDGCRNGN